jgi:hypothetical protein
MVWKKNAERYKAKTEEKCQQLFKQIEAWNRQEGSQYGSQDLEENGTSSAITKEAIAEYVCGLNEKIKQAPDKRTKRKAATVKRKLKEAESKIEKYEQQIRISAKRSGYNRTDKDASAMMMKNRVEILPAYNVLAGSEEQFITGLSVHQNTNDGVCFKDHLEQVAGQQPFTPDSIIADSIFGTEQNYELLKERGIENYLKFPYYHTEQKGSYQKKIFLKDNFPYDPLTDSYQCPTGQRLTFRKKYKQTHKRTGYPSLIKEYECTDCGGCPFYQQCCKSSKGLNRSIQVNERLDDYKHQARENLGTELGIRLKKKRSIEIESCFGDIKHNMGFRRFHLRGLKKVKTEFALIAMAHNLRKISLQGTKKAV